MPSYSHRGATAFRRTFTLLSLIGAAAASLTLMAPAAMSATAQSYVYQSTPLVASGDRIGNTQIPPGYDLFVGGLTDSGQIVFSAGNYEGTKPELLMQWGKGGFTPIVVPASGPASAGTGDVFWPWDVTIDRPVSMNKSGKVLFSADLIGDSRSWGTFLWDPQKQNITPIVLKGMPATGSLVFTAPGGVAPAINNANAMALVGQVKDPMGLSGYGLFYLAPHGALRSVLLPGEVLPRGQGKAVTDEFLSPSINDADTIAFLSRAHTSSRYGAYVWQYGAISPLLIAGQETPGAEGGKITGVSSVFVNNHDSSALVTATTDRTGSSRHGIYRVLNGRIKTVAAPGRSMPGGGTLKTVQYVYTRENSPPTMAISCPNAQGQQAFLATLDDGSTAAYEVDPNGLLTLIFKINAQPPPVHITAVAQNMTFVPGSRPCLNSHGQVALSVRLQGGHSMIVLLTPSLH